MKITERGEPLTRCNNKVMCFRNHLRNAEHSYSSTKKKKSNKTLCEKCNESYLSRNIAESRWRLFGHFLYRNEKMQTNKAAQQHFITLEIDSGKNNYNPPSDHSVTIKRLVNSQDRFTPKIISIVVAYTKINKGFKPPFAP